MYAITETTGAIVAATWEPIKAKTLGGAKRAATHAQAFHGTTIAVAQAAPNGGWKPMSIKQPADKLNMNSKAVWRELF